MRCRLDRSPRLDTRQPSTILLRPCKTQTSVGQSTSKGKTPTQHSFHGLLCSCGLVLVSLLRPSQINATKGFPTGLIYHLSTQGVTSCVAEACPAATDALTMMSWPYGDRLPTAQHQVGAQICVPHCCHMVEGGRLRQAAKHWCCVFVNSTIYCCHSTGMVPVDACTAGTWDALLGYLLQCGMVVMRVVLLQ